MGGDGVLGGQGDDERAAIAFTLNHVLAVFAPSVAHATDHCVGAIGCAHASARVG